MLHDPLFPPFYGSFYGAHEYVRSVVYLCATMEAFHVEIAKNGL